MNKIRLSDRNHIDRVYQQELYGRKCYVVGTTADSLQSTTYFRSVFTSLKPTLVIMGGFNNSRLLTSRIARTFNDKLSMRTYDSFAEANKMFCKALVTPMVSKILESDPQYNRDEREQFVARFDHRNKHIWHSNEMTIISKVISSEFIKLSFGLPSDYIIFQDIMIHQSLETLKSICHKLIDSMVLNKNKYGQPTKSTHFYPEIVMQQLRYNALNEPVLTSKQLTYTTALLNKYTSTSEKVILFVENQFVHQIAENVHKITIDPKDVFRQGHHNNLDSFIQNTENSETKIKINEYLNADDKNRVVDELLEKFAILNILKNDTLEKQLMENQQNVFNKTVFKSLFQNLTLDQIMQRYTKAKKQHRLKFGEIISERVKNTANFKQSQKNLYTLSEMIMTQQQRNEDFPIELKPMTIQSLHREKIDLKEINDLIEVLSRTEITPSEKQLLEKHKKGTMTRQSIVLLNKLFVEAKIRLKKTNIKLPIHHFSALSAIFKEQIKNNILRKNIQSETHTQEEVFKKKLKNLEEKGTIRQIKTLKEFQELDNSQAPRMSISFSQGGQVDFNHDCRTPEQFDQLVDTIKNDEFFQDLVDVSEKADQTGKTSIFYEEDITNPQNKANSINSSNPANTTNTTNTAKTEKYKSNPQLKVKKWRKKK